MQKEIISTNTRGAIRDFIDETRTYLETIEMLNDEITVCNTSSPDDQKRASYCGIARDLVLDEAKRKLQLFDNFLVYGTQNVEDQSGEEAQA